MWKHLFNLAKKIKPSLKLAAPVLLVLSFILILIGIWWAGPWLEVYKRHPLDSILERTLATIIFTLSALIALMYYQWRQLRNEKKAQEMDAKNRENPIQNAKNHQQDELDAVMAQLKTNLNRRNYLYALPWYLVLGLENTGKSSLIHRSGQTFVLTAALEHIKEQRINTHGFDFWISDTAVLIDPDGELLSQTESNENANQKPISKNLWEHFTHWLANTRSRRPLNGVILTLDLATLSVSKLSERKRYAYILRDRLSQLTNRLSTRLPLYIAFTKLDKLQGFEPFFRNYTRQEREAVLGFTFSMDSVDHLDAWLDEFDKSYTDFIHRLNESLPKTFMHNTLNSEENAAVFSFIRQISGIRQLLKDLFQESLSSSTFATPPLVRGVYFTSVYQQDAPFNAFINSAAGRYDLPPVINSAQKAKNSTTYFASKLFPNIIYPEAGLASDNFRVVKQKKRLIYLSIATCTIASVLLIGAWHRYYTKNTRYSNAVLTQVNRYETRYAKHLNAGTVQDILGPLNVIRKATLAFGFFHEEPRYVADLGLYQGHTIGPKVEETYLNLLKFRFLPVLMAQLAVELGQAQNEEEKLEKLRVFRMMTDQSGRYDHVVEDYFTHLWQHEFFGQRNTQNALQGHLHYAMAHTNLTGDRTTGNTEAEAVLKPYDALIARYQKELGAIPIEYRVYRNLKQTASVVLGAPLVVTTRVGPVFDLIFQQREYDKNHLLIPQFLTKEGYTSYFIPQVQSISKQALIDSWVLGQSKVAEFSEADKAFLEEKIRDQYITDYNRTWRSALNDIDVKYFADITDAISVLDNITGSMQPFSRLLGLLDHNTNLFPPLPEDDTARMALMKTPKYQVAARIDKPFDELTGMLQSQNDQPSNMAELLTAIEQLRAYLKGIQESPDMGSAALEATKARVMLKKQDPIYDLKRIASGLPAPINQWANRLADESWYTIKQEAIKHLDIRWKNEIYTVYQQKLAHRYPFDPKAKKDVALKDFNDFFAPQGLLSRFYQEQLKMMMDENLSINKNAKASLISTQLMTQLNQAKRIRNAFFNRKGILNIEFSLEPMELSANTRRSIINIDGQYVDYSHGLRNSVALIWPNTLRTLTTSKVTLIPAASNQSPRGLTQQGPWAFFHLLDQAHISSASATSVDYRFVIGHHSMRYRIHAEADANPFVSKLFQSFHLPKTLY